jgi:hypothetical protein
MNSTSIISRLQKRDRPADLDEIIIVSGLPRSGTSMMMKILESGGQAVHTDHERAPDENNQLGYYEFERVKALRTGDDAWLSSAVGKAVKVISALLEYLPAEYSYKVIFMRRNLDEVLASQRQMLIRAGKDPDTVSDEQLKRLYQGHLEKVESWLAMQPEMKTTFVSYNDLLTDPEVHIRQIQQFIGKDMRLQEMIQVVNPALYRERKQ